MSSGSGSGLGFFNHTSNTSPICAARYIQGPVEIPHPPALTITMRAIVFLCYLCLVIGGSFLNFLVIVLVAKFKKLQTHSFFIALQIVILNFLVSLSHSRTLVTSLVNRWVFGAYLCAASGAVVFVGYTVRSYLMLVFVIDRFLSVFWPYFYPKHQFKFTGVLMAIS